MFVKFVAQLTMNNNSGAREIIDCWEYNGYSWAVILYPSGVLYLQWIDLL
jgi:hypothetical protein